MTAVWTGYCFIERFNLYVQGPSTWGKTRDKEARDSLYGQVKSKTDGADPPSPKKRQ